MSRVASGHGPASAPPLVREVLATPGSALDPGVRTDMERRLGHDFGAVRVHTDARAADSAAAVASAAYTVGSHVVLGRAALGGEQGRRILAHELVHTIQQGGRPPGAGPLPVSSPSDAGEREAERLAQVATSQPTTGQPATSEPRTGQPVIGQPATSQPTTSQPTTGQPVFGRPAAAGGAVMQASSEPAVQRACGGAEIGSVAGCTNRGGDIADFGSSSDDVFLFVRNCDDMATGEATRLTDYAARIGPDDDVSIDGFASEEGSPEFNVDLACARAKAAADVLSTAGATPRTMLLYSHGATPGDRDMHRSAVITVTPVPESRQPEEQEPSPTKKGPPAPETEDCEPWQVAMITSHLADARTWVNDAYRKIADYAYVFASSRHSAVPKSAATASVVRGALMDNFHTTEPGHVLQIRDNFLSLRTALNQDVTWECEDEGCDDGAYVRGAFAFIRRLGDVHVCPPWFAGRYHYRVATLIHERAHQYPGADDHAYNHDASYATLSPDDAIDNAESYGIAARQIYHGGAYGPGW